MSASKLTARILIVISLLSCNLSFAKSKQPKIVIDTLEYNLGIIDRKASSPIRSFYINVKNGGKAPLIINKVLRDCEHCTIVEIQDSIIQKKKSSQLTVTFDSKAFFSGPIEKSIFVYTNDLECPEIEIRFKAELR